MNFNLMFELGYAMGLGIPVIPIRDTTCTLDSKEFESLGLIDTLGYLDFQNSEDLAANSPQRSRKRPFQSRRPSPQIENSHATSFEAQS